MLVIVLAATACGRLGLSDYNIYPPAVEVSSNDTTPFGMVAWFQLDGDLRDAVSGQTAQCTTNCPTSTTGVVAGGAAFDGVNQCVKVPWLAGWQPDVYTIAAWVNASAASGPVVVRTYDAGGCPSPALEATNRGLGFRGMSKMLSHQEAWTSPMLVQSTWQHLAIVWDGTQQQIFVDGTCTCGITPPVGFRYNDTAGVSIGCYPEASTYLHGVIDDVRIYDRVLAPDELAILASEDGRARPTPVDCSAVCGTTAP
jgi:hypothetical protein